MLSQTGQLAIAAAALSLLVVCTGCSPGGDAETAVAPDSVRDQATVAVGRRDVTNVLTLDGTVVASPDLLVTSPGDGPLKRVVQDGSPPLPSGAPVGTVGGQPITLPGAGGVTGWLVPDGAIVRRALPLATVHDVGFAVSAQVPPADSYRIRAGASSARAAITGGPSGFECAVATGAPQDGQDPGVLCLIPDGVQAYAGVPALIALRAGESLKALALPVTAVSGAADQGQVTRVTAGKTSRVDVELGVSDGSYVEITSGLSEGDVVLSHAPSLAP